VATWGGPGSQPGEFNFPSDIVTLADGTLLVVDVYNFRVQAISPLGDPLYSWGDHSAVNALVMCLEPSGTVLINSFNTIRRFTPTGSFVKEWVSHDSRPGEYLSIAGIATDATGNVYVVENATHRVQKYASDGTFLLNWVSNGDGGDPQLLSPYDIAIAPDGRVFVLDAGAGEGFVQIYTQDGAFLSRWGSGGLAPVSIAFTPAGDVLIADASRYKVVSFDAGGNFLFEFGGYGTGPGQFPAQPLAVAIDQDHRIYVTDRADRISKFVESPAPVSPLSLGRLRSRPRWPVEARPARRSTPHPP